MSNEALSPSVIIIGPLHFINLEKKPLCTAVYFILLRFHHHFQMLNPRGDDAPASLHWKIIKAPYFSLIPSFRLIQMSVPEMNVCHLCDAQLEVKSTTFQHASRLLCRGHFVQHSSLCFCQAHFLVSLPWPPLENITVNTSSISPCSLPPL